MFRAVATGESGLLASALWNRGQTENFCMLVAATIWAPVSLDVLLSASKSEGPGVAAAGGGTLSPSIPKAEAEKSTFAQTPLPGLHFL